MTEGLSPRADTCLLRARVIEMLDAALVRGAEPATRARTGALWDEVCAGRWEFIDRFEHAGRRLLVARRAARVRGGAALTRAEVLCMAAVLDRALQKVVAADLGVSESTVSTHVRRAMRKLGIATRAELALLVGEGAEREGAAGSAT